MLRVDALKKNCFLLVSLFVWSICAENASQKEIKVDQNIIKGEMLEPSVIATIPYLNTLKEDMTKKDLWETFEDAQYFDLFPNINKADHINTVSFDNRTDYCMILRKAKKPLYSQANYTVRQDKGFDFFYINPEDNITINTLIRDLNEPEIFLYDVFLVPKEGGKAYFFGKVLFGFSCNRLVINAIMASENEWSDSEKYQFDGLVTNCLEPNGYIKAYVREHHREFFTSWGAYFIDKGYKKMKFADGTESELRLWIYYHGNKNIGIGFQKRRPVGTPCIKNGKPGKVIPDESCKIE